MTRNGSTDVVNTYAFKTTVDKFSAFKIANINGTFGASLPVYAVVQVQNSNVTQEMVGFELFVAAVQSYAQERNFQVTVLLCGQYR